ncbi:protein adenylyltransferase SelO family protein [Halobacteriovorax sp. XZX-3]|uniref:protein adenylyltransferase SelO n=1 Tax=unclassified Halobacteriovorax TaxID=2639665 RepID=UPI00371DBF6D
MIKLETAYKGLREFKNLTGRPQQTPGAHFSRVTPEKSPAPKELCWSGDLARAMGITEEHKSSWLSLLSGNQESYNPAPIATRYGGHQFGHWAGQLGDGRAMTLGLYEGLEVQLKGAGLTPYSRGADGKAVLRSSLREYICSEAMYNLGVPTTRALCLVETGEQVLRDMFYDGNAAYEKGAICTRVAPSFLRFGHYQIHAANHELEELTELVNFTIDNYFPGMSIAQMFKEVVRRSAFLMSEWMRVGFVHGVMNTDNLSMLGLTIDYGPYGWLDRFDPNWTPNTTDFRERRYRFINQVSIAYWNLAQLKEALQAVCLESLDEALDQYPEYFHSFYQESVAKKLGLKTCSREFIDELFDLKYELQADMTLFYRTLMSVMEGKDISWQDAFYKSLSDADLTRINTWVTKWQREQKLQRIDPMIAFGIMNEVNPAFIPRNYIVQMVLDDLEKGDETSLRNLEKAIANPYELNEFTRPFLVKAPDWSTSRPGCSTLSCSS